MDAHYRILVVDDDEINVSAMEEILSDDYEVATARNGEEAIRMAPRFRPHVVLLDVMMPGLDGYDTCRRIKANPHLRSANVILVSARDETTDRLTGYEAGADDYITKPFDSEELLAKIRVFLRTGSAPTDKRVLIVDDDPMILRLLEKQLTVSGYEVLSATNGADALRIVLAEGPSIVVTDWVMPEMDGLELCRALRSMDDIGLAYIIILTGQQEDQSVVEAFEAGADDFLTKPFRPQELVARLSPGNRIIALEASLERRNRALHEANAELTALNQKLETLATTDALTGLANRRQAMLRLHEQWEIAKRYDQPLACVVLDLDRFKQVNDQHGHAAGDVVLREVAATLNEATRTGETVCRLGGEEFLVLCVNATVEMAAAAAERLRQAVEAARIVHEGQELPITCSGGVAGRDPTMRSVDDLLKRADNALYEAKGTGRNRICAAEVPVEEPQLGVR